MARGESVRNPTPARSDDGAHVVPTGAHLMPEIPIEPMATRIDQLTNVGTYGGAAATGAGALLQWLGDYQSGLTVLVVILTGLVSISSALYGMYHKHRIRRIAERQGFDALRRSDLS